MKNYLFNEKQLKKILEQVENSEKESSEEKPKEEVGSVGAGYFDNIVSSPLDSSDPLKMFFDSLN